MSPCSVINKLVGVQICDSIPQITHRKMKFMVTIFEALACFRLLFLAFLFIFLGLTRGAFRIYRQRSLCNPR
jgi:hypothetical protein